VQNLRYDKLDDFALVFIDGFANWQIHLGLAFG
jgi:hypothetical protein